MKSICKQVNELLAREQRELEQLNTQLERFEFGKETREQLESTHDELMTLVSPRHREARFLCKWFADPNTDKNFDQTVLLDNPSREANKLRDEWLKQEEFELVLKAVS